MLLSIADKGYVSGAFRKRIWQKAPPSGYCWRIGRGESCRVSDIGLSSAMRSRSSAHASGNKRWAVAW